MCKKQYGNEFKFIYRRISFNPCFLAVFSMQELIEHPLINQFSKLFWFLIIWLVPFIGVAVFIKSYKLEKTTGKYDNNNVDGTSYDDE